MPSMSISKPSPRRATATLTSTAARSAPSPPARSPFPTAPPQGMAEKKFTVYRTHHGPIVREANGKWVAIRLMQEPIKALTQSYTRTKAHELQGLSPDHGAQGQLLQQHDLRRRQRHHRLLPRQLHSAPRHQLRLDQARGRQQSRHRVEGPARSQRGAATCSIPRVGWLYNTNNWPWSAAGPSSPKKENFPAYVENGGESARGLHAIRVLQNKKDFTLDSLIAAAYDSYLPWFDKPMPALIKAWDADARRRSPEGQARRADRPPAQMGSPLGRRTPSPPRSPSSGARMSAAASAVAAAAPARPARPRRRHRQRARRATPAIARRRQSDKLAADFGSWKTPWGDINRYQRLTGDIVQPFNDAGPSIPVAFTSSQWGSLASFGARAYPGTKKWYGTSGNSFVAVVEFGKTVRARAVTAGGESGDPKSPHFNDQAEPLRHRHSSRSLLLPRPTQGPHQGGVPPGKLSHGRGHRLLTRAALIRAATVRERLLFLRPHCTSALNSNL